MEIHFGDIVLAGVLGLLAWFIQRKFASYDEQHGKHFDHAANTLIHRESMDRELIESKFENINQRFDHLGEKIDTLGQEVLRGRETAHQLGNDIMKALAEAMKSQKVKS